MFVIVFTCFEEILLSKHIQYCVQFIFYLDFCGPVYAINYFAYFFALIKEHNKMITLQYIYDNHYGLDLFCVTSGIITGPMLLNITSTE